MVLGALLVLDYRRKQNTGSGEGREFLEQDLGLHHLVSSSCLGAVTENPCCNLTPTLFHSQLGTRGCKE